MKCSIITAFSVLLLFTNVAEANVFHRLMTRVKVNKALRKVGVNKALWAREFSRKPHITKDQALPSMKQMVRGFRARVHDLAKRSTSIATDGLSMHFYKGNNKIGSLLANTKVATHAGSWDTGVVGRKGTVKLIRGSQELGSFTYAEGIHTSGIIFKPGKREVIVSKKEGNTQLMRSELQPQGSYNNPEGTLRINNKHYKYEVENGRVINMAKVSR